MCVLQRRIQTAPGYTRQLPSTGTNACHFPGFFPVNSYKEPLLRQFVPFLRESAAQSAVSRTISSMEQELGYPLFVRFHQDTRLTAAGVVLRDGLQILYREYCDLTREAEKASKRASGTLAIGFLEGQLMDPQTQQTLLEMEKELPEVRNHIVRSSFGNLVNQLMREQLDVIFTMDFAVEGIGNLKYVPVRTLKHYLMIPKSNPLVAKKDLKLSDFREEQFISVKNFDAPRLTALIQESCRKAGFEPKVVEVDSLSEVLLWTETGRGIGIFNEYYSACFSPLLERYEFPEFPERNMVLAWDPKNGNPLIPNMVARME